MNRKHMNNNEEGPTEEKYPEWQQFPELKRYVKEVIQNNSGELGHVDPEQILYLAFSKKKSADAANIRATKGILNLFRNEAYIMSVWIEHWNRCDEKERFYIIKHEMLHIPEDGFEPHSKQFKKLLKHDLQDFKSLVYETGVYKENIENIIPGKNSDSKSPEEE